MAVKISDLRSRNTFEFNDLESGTHFTINDSLYVKMPEGSAYNAFNLNVSTWVNLNDNTDVVLVKNINIELLE